MDNTGYTIGWIIWLGLFVALEGFALLDKDPGDTFTEHFRRWMRLRTPVVGSSNRLQRACWWISRTVVVLFGAWLTTHMAFGWFGGGEGFLG